MTFQYPFMLAGLAVAALPIVLNLLGRAVARPRVWGAMMFLDRSASPARFGTSRQSLLLLSRVGMLSALVLAFARPVKSSGSTAGVELILVIDTGPSMRLFDAGINRLDRAKAAALKSLSTLKADDLAALVASGVTIDATGDLQSVAARINELSTVGEASNLSACMRTAAAMSTANCERQNQLCVFGDLTATDWPRATLAIDKRQKLFTFNVGNGGLNDLQLQNLSVSTPLGRRVSASVKLVNTASAAQDVRLHWAIDLAEVSTSAVNVPGYGSAIASLAPVPLALGQHLVSASLDEAVPSTVPHAQLVFTLLPPPRVLVYGSTAAVVAAAMPADDVQWAMDVSSPIAPSCDLLVVTGLPRSSGTPLATLARFVRDGGQLLVIPGDDFDEAAITALLDKVNLLPVRPPLISAATADLRLTRAGGAVPAVRRLSWNSLSRESHELIPFPGALPLAVTMSAGRGAVMLATTGPGDRWSMLADSPTLRPWLSTLVNGLCPVLRAEPTVVAGESYTASTPAPVDAHSAVVRTPDGQTEGIIVDRSATTCELRYPRTQQTGVYRISFRSNGRPDQKFFIATSPPPVESKHEVEPRTLTGSRTSEQLLQTLTADRPTRVDEFWPLLASSMALFAVSVFLEAPPGWKRA